MFSKYKMLQLLLPTKDRNNKQTHYLHGTEMEYYQMMVYFRHGWIYKFAKNNSNNDIVRWKILTD